jgi:hypothetical protein
MPPSATLTKDPHGPALTFSARHWRTFTAAVSPRTRPHVTQIKRTIGCSERASLCAVSTPTGIRMR